MGAWRPLVSRGLKTPQILAEIFKHLQPRVSTLPRLTMSSLATNARRCPQLQELSLPEIRLSTLPDEQHWTFTNHLLHSLLVPKTVLVVVIVYEEPQCSSIASSHLCASSNRLRERTIGAYPIEHTTRVRRASRSIWKLYSWDIGAASI